MINAIRSSVFKGRTLLAGTAAFAFWGISKNKNIQSALENDENIKTIRKKIEGNSEQVSNYFKTHTVENTSGNSFISFFSPWVFEKKDKNNTQQILDKASVRVPSSTRKC